MGILLSRLRRAAFLAVCLASAWLGALHPGAPASEPSGEPKEPSAENLGKGVPSDVGLYLRFKIDRGSRSSAYWERFLESLRNSGFFQEFVGALLDSFDVEIAAIRWSGLPVPARFEKRTRRSVSRERWLDLLGRPNWSDALSREVVVAARWEAGSPDFLFLSRLEPRTQESTAEAIRRILYALASLSPAVEIVESWSESEKTLVFGRSSGSSGLSVAIRDNVLFLSTNPLLLRRSLQLFGGQSSDLGYVDSPERLEAIASLPIGIESRTEFEMHLRFSRMGRPAAEAGLPESFAILARASDAELRYAFRLAFPSGGADSAFSTRTSGLSTKRIPRGARGFEASTGWDFEGALAVTASIEKPLLELLESATKSGILAGPWPDRCRQFYDLLSELGPFLRAPRTYVSLPAGDVLLFELPEAQVPERAEKALSRIEEALGARRMPEKAVPFPGLRWVELPAGFPLCEDGTLVWGVSSGCLVFATSSESLKEAFQAGSPLGETDLPEFVGERWEKSRIAELLRIRSLERPWGPAIARLACWLVSFPAREEAERLPVLETLRRLVPAIDAGNLFARERSYVVREGDSVLGFGRFEYAPTPAPSPKERQF